jgi:hypothetical protein
MWVKLVLLFLFGLMIVGAFHFVEPRALEEQGSSNTFHSLR